MKKIALTVAGVLALLRAGLGISQLAQADDATPSPSPSASSSTEPGAGERDMRQAPRAGATMTARAGATGITAPRNASIARRSPRSSA